eukprot:gene17151-35496_t
MLQQACGLFPRAALRACCKRLQWRGLRSRRALYFLEPMLNELGLGTSPGERDHLAMPVRLHLQTPFMLLTPLLIVELAVLGLGTGFLAGLLGIGGGMLMVPFITFILSAQGVEADLAVKMAIATSMATIVFTSVSSVRAHHQRGAVRWDLAKRLAPGIVLGGFV